MALPASGQITINNLRGEMSQSIMSNYSLGASSYGFYAGYDNIYYCPINVHSSNTNDYPVNGTVPLSDWYNYDNTLYYASDGTFRDHFLTYYGYCYASSMLIFDLGTTNKTWDITISGSANDFTGIDLVNIHYGKPWSNNGITTGSFDLIERIYVNQSNYNNTISYSYTYNSNKGQYLYVVAIAGCY